MEKNFKQNNKKIITILLICFISLSLFSTLNKASADVTFYSFVSTPETNSPPIEEQHPSVSTEKSALTSSFKPISSGYLFGVQLYLKRSDNSPTMTVRASIYNGTGLNSPPSYSLINSTNSVDVSTLSTDFEWIPFYFDYNIFLNSSLYYHVVLFAESASYVNGRSCQWAYANGGSSLTMGGSFYSNSFQAMSSGNDYLMVLNGDASIPDPSESPEPSKTIMPQIKTIINVLDFFLGDDGSITNAGFGLLIFFGVCLVCFFLSGKSFLGFVVGVNLGFIINLIGSLWQSWVLIPMVLLDVILILKGSGFDFGSLRRNGD